MSIIAETKKGLDFNFDEYKEHIKEMGDWYTIVSIVPCQIGEFKPGLNPGYFEIPACEDISKPQLLYVTNGYHQLYGGESIGYIPVNNSAQRIAESVVFDYVNSQLGVKNGAIPGLFCVPGKLTWEKIMLDKIYAARYQKAKEDQFNWFREVCKIAANDWNRYHNHVAISDFQRKVAVILGLSATMNEWMIQDDRANGIECPNCGKINSKKIASCVCGCIINEEKYKSLKFIQKG